MLNKNFEGNLGKEGDLSPKQTPLPLTPKVYVHDLEHDQELVGFCQRGQHGYVYRPKDDTHKS